LPWGSMTTRRRSERREMMMPRAVTQVCSSSLTTEAIGAIPRGPNRRIGDARLAESAIATHNRGGVRGAGKRDEIVIVAVASDRRRINVIQHGRVASMRSAS
jgi:hypothetical protein